MNQSVDASARPDTAAPATELDAMIIGAGVAGLYQLHQLRELGLEVRAYDAGSGVGGTWYWNRYPGARLDSEAPIYQYFFSEALYKNWDWKERFATQEDVEAWLNYVADSLDLRRDIRLDTTITAARWDEGRERWIVETSTGEIVDTQFLVTCCGMLSAPLADLFPGQESFRGRIFHTARWPREPVELSGKRVGVIGTGATGIQVIQTIAAEVGQLKVFVRTPQYVLAMKNPAFGPEEVAGYKARYDEVRQIIPNTMSGFDFEIKHSWDSLGPAERREVLEEAYADGSLKFWLATFGEMFVDDAVNAEVSDFIREKMRARLQDEDLCDVLIPRDFGFGTHRVPLATAYLEAFRRENVEAVPVKLNPIVEIVPEGIRLADGAVHELDVIIMATGFDAGTGALTRIDIRGRDGRSLREAWSRDITSTMGLQISGYPNLFTTAAPLAPSAALCNMTTCLQQQTEWISDCIRHLRETGRTVIEPAADMEAEWVRHHEEVAAGTLMIRTDSYYLGSNVPGKPRRLLAYAGGVGTYRQKCAEVAASGYAGFTMR